MKRNKTEYLFFQSTEEMWEFMVRKWREISSTEVREKGSFSVALSGGKTPIGFYQRLASLEGLPWDRTHIFFVDERFVPPTDAVSNYRMIRENLLERVPITPLNVHPISTAESSPRSSAMKYEEELRAFFELPSGGVPEFDLVLLGIGEDGHTGSLFPGTEALKEKTHLTASVTMGASVHDRITLTLPLINGARNIFFLVSGNRKSAVMKRVMDGKDDTLPASMVQPVNGKLFFLMDKEARGD